MRPIKVTDVELAFPARVDHLMPSYQEALDGLDRLSCEERKMWNDFADRRFAGYPKPVWPSEATVVLAEGIDGNEAIRHLDCVLGSFQPKHEHKMAAVAYLASQWFTSFNPGGS